MNDLAFAVVIVVCVLVAVVGILPLINSARMYFWTRRQGR